MKKIIFTFLCIVFLNKTFTQTTEKWTLKQCVDYAVKNNISVKQADIQARITALHLQQSKMYKLPTANLNTSLSTAFGRSIDFATNSYTSTSSFSNNLSIGGNVQIFSFNKLKNDIAANEFNAKAALADIEKISNDIALSVATYYLQVLASYQQINIITVQIQQTLSNLANTRKRVDAGSLPELNALEIESQLAVDSSNLVNANTNYQQSILALKGVLNIDAAKDFAVEIPDVNKIPIEQLTDLQPEHVYALASNHQPNVKANLLRIEAAKKNILSAKSALYPSITGSYSLGSGYMDYLSGNSFVKSPYFTQLSNNFSQNLGVNISVPIFNYGTAKINQQQSMLNLQNIQTNQQQIEQKLKLDIYTAYSNAVNALQKLNASTKQVAVAQQSFNLASKRYDVGLLNTLDLLTNQNNLLRAKTQNIADKYEYIFKMKVLEFYKGQGLTL